jgi:hypothetical protein
MTEYVKVTYVDFAVTLNRRSSSPEYTSAPTQAVSEPGINVSPISEVLRSGHRRIRSTILEADCCQRVCWEVGSNSIRYQLRQIHKFRLPFPSSARTSSPWVTVSARNCGDALETGLTSSPTYGLMQERAKETFAFADETERMESAVLLGGQNDGVAINQQGSSSPPQFFLSRSAVRSHSDRSTVGGSLTGMNGPPGYRRIRSRQELRLSACIKATDWAVIGREQE